MHASITNPNQLHYFFVLECKLRCYNFEKINDTGVETVNPICCPRNQMPLRKRAGSLLKPTIPSVCAVLCVLTFV